MSSILNAGSRENPLDRSASEVIDLSEKLSHAIKKLKHETEAKKPKHQLVDFRRVIYETRKARGLSMLAVAELAGISKNAYQAIEKGDADPKLETACSIAGVFGLNLWVE